MGRMSFMEKSRYTRMEPEVLEGCFYCGNKAAIMMDDTTPSHKVSEEYKSVFKEEWTIVRICQSCWSSINQANIRNQAKGFDTLPGLMTVAQKRILIKGGSQMSGPTLSKPGQFILHKNGMLMPAEAMIDVETQAVFVSGRKYFQEEMISLQGAMALALLGKTDYLAKTLQLLIQGDREDLDVSRMEMYFMLFGLMDDPNHGKF